MGEQGRIYVARSCDEDETNLSEPLPRVAYASHDLSDAEAIEAMENAGLDSRMLPHRRAMGWGEACQPFDELFESIEGRFMVDVNDRLRVAADRFARILTWVGGRDPDTYGALGGTEWLADAIHAKLKASEEDVDFLCASCGAFLRTMDVDNLIDVLPAQDDMQSAILNALILHARVAVEAAVAKVGRPDETCRISDVERTLHSQIDNWRRRYPAIEAASSDVLSASLLADLETFDSVEFVEESRSAAVRLAALIASVAGIGESRDEPATAHVSTSIRRHGSLEIRARGWHEWDDSALPAVGIAMSVRRDRTSPPIVSIERRGRS